MKTRRLVLCGVLTIAMASCIRMLVAQPSSWAMPVEEPKVRAVFDFGGPLPEVPSEMLVYRTLEPSISERHIEGLLTTLGLDAEIHDTDEMLFVHQGAQVIEAFKRQHTGYFRYSDDDKLSLQESVRNLPSEEEAIDRAERLLLQHELMPDASPTPRTDYLQYGVIDSEGEWVEEGRSALAVGFTFEVGGYRFVGPGAKAGVVFGENGQVIAVSRIWREIEADRYAPVQPMDYAVDLFKEYWPPQGGGG
jgi:hypothetical protein